MDFANDSYWHELTVGRLETHFDQAVDDEFWPNSDVLSQATAVENGRRKLIV